MSSTVCRTTDVTHPDIPGAFFDPEDKNRAPVKMAPPDGASRILKAMGYPVNPRLLRKWAKEGSIPSCWTGRRLLIKLSAVIEFMEEGTGFPCDEDEI